MAIAISNGKEWVRTAKSGVHFAIATVTWLRCLFCASVDPDFYWKSPGKVLVRFDLCEK